jgi:hypothetical protein
MAFAAARGDTKFFAQLRHGRDAGLHGTADFAFRDVVADTDDHDTAQVGWISVELLVPFSGGKDELVHLRQPQAVDPSLMVNLDFALLLKQLLTLDARRLGCRGRGKAAFPATVHFHWLPRRSAHLVILL